MAPKVAMKASKSMKDMKAMKASKSMKDMTPMKAAKSRIANMTFASFYPLYINKVEKKGRTKDELLQVIQLLTGFGKAKLQELIKSKVTFDTFFRKATLHPHAKQIRGIVCGHRIEEINDPLTKKVRCLDKLVDELAKGIEIEKILR